MLFSEKNLFSGKLFLIFYIAQCKFFDKGYFYIQEFLFYDWQYSD